MPGSKRQRTSTGYTGGTQTGSKGRSKGKRKNSRITVPKNKLAFPQSLRTKLRYVVRREFEFTNTTAIQVRMRANDLYDPEYATGGHQPRGFDELMNVYGSYTVIGSKCHAQFMYEGYMGPTVSGAAGNLLQTVSAVPNGLPETPALPPVCIGIHKGVETLSAGTAEEQIEKERTSWKFMTPGTGAQTLTSTVTQKDFFGKEAIVGAAGYSGTDSKGVTEDLFFEIWGARVDNNYSAGNIRVPVYITVEYDAVFTDPKTLAAS